jgi:hypothetical protein
MAHLARSKKQIYEKSRNLYPKSSEENKVSFMFIDLGFLLCCFRWNIFFSLHFNENIREL